MTYFRSLICFLLLTIAHDLGAWTSGIATPPELPPPPEPQHPPALHLQAPQQGFDNMGISRIPPRPRHEMGIQGTHPDYVYPQVPMQLEHHDAFMSYPQPLRNPYGPKAYQLPMEESTMPREDYTPFY